MKLLTGIFQEIFWPGMLLRQIKNSISNERFPCSLTNLFHNSFLHRPRESVITSRFYKIIVEKCSASDCWNWKKKNFFLFLGSIGKQGEKQIVWMSFVFLYYSILKSMFRNSHRRCSLRKVVLWNFAKFTG